MFDFYLLPQVTWITDAQFRRLRAALALSTAVTAEDYELAPPSFALASSAAEIPDSAIPMVFGPSTDHPEFLAYHELLYGRPYVFVLADASRMTLADVECGAGHEADETLVDPFATGYKPLRNGDLIAFEIDDPVQADTIPYEVEGQIVTMPNHVLPAWFDLDPEDGLENLPKLDAAGVCTVPRAIRPDGYAMVIDASGSVHRLGAGPAGYKRSPLFRYGRRLSDAHRLALQRRLGDVVRTPCLRR